MCVVCVSALTCVRSELDLAKKHSCPQSKKQLKTLIMILGEGHTASANKALKRDFDVEVGVPSDNGHLQ